MQSDDDANTTTSDIDSQPATPSSQIDPSEDPQSPTIYTYDGVFKVPRARTDSVASQSEQEYIIAQRTRSKISLTETPIEAIESTFKAPDAPLDMYQTDFDVDDDWAQFLKNFGMPLSKFSEYISKGDFRFAIIKKRQFFSNKCRLAFSLLATDMEKDDDDPDPDPDYCPKHVDHHPGM